MHALKLALAVVMMLLGACVSAPAPRAVPVPTPTLRLSPADFGRSVALQQRLEFRVDGHRNVLEALLEIDPDDVRIALHGSGQIALRLSWDGRTLQEVRADWLPATLTGERVLNDLQLVFWPAAQVRAALPPSWRLDEGEGTRELLLDDAVIARVAYRDDGEARLDHLGAGYALRVQSQEAEP